MDRSTRARLASLGARALGWLALSGAAIFLNGYWERLIPRAYIVWAQPTERIARISATTKPPVTVALVVLWALAVLALVSAVVGDARESARRISAAARCFGAHLLVLLTAIVVSSPLRTEEELSASGILSARDQFISAYPVGLCLWQAWAATAFAGLALLALPLLYREKGALVPALRLAAASLLALAPFSFAWLAGTWTLFPVVLSAAPLWLAAEIKHAPG